MIIAAPIPDAHLQAPEGSDFESGGSQHGRPELEEESSEARIPAPLREAMAAKGYTELTAVQTAVVESLFDGRDLLISSQTGSGKTVALGISMADELIAAGAKPRGAGPKVLVITPTRELAGQVQRELGWLYAGVHGVSVTVVTGGTNVGVERRALARSPRVVVGTPGRMLDHIKSGKLDCSEVSQVVLDEADQMLDMGFRDELEGILETTPKERRTHLVSATFAPPIRKLAKRYQRDPLHIEGTRLGDVNQDIEHVAHLVREEDRYAALVNLLLLTGEKRTLVFVNTRAAAAEIANQLLGDGFAAQPLSGELAQVQRTRTLDAFRAGSVQVLVATDVAARGLDIPDVATVVHGGPPDDSEAFVHRSGRTGRAGRKGRCVLLVTPRSRRHVERLVYDAGVEPQWRPLPTAEFVRAELAQEERARIGHAIERGEGVGLEHMAHAEELLGARDPVEVVAALLATVKPKGVREPMDVQPATQARRKDKREFDKGGERYQGKPYRQESNRHQKGGGRPQGRFSSANFTPFKISIGFRQGATPARLVAMLCRRGGIPGKALGAIQIDAHMSTFEVARNVARGFETKALRTDPRDPKVRIKRL